MAAGEGRTTPSLFAFANLTAPLGGPPPFYVTGVAAGFGYNRKLIPPKPGDVATYPLVRDASDRSLFGGEGATPEGALSVLSAVAPPSVGDYWVAAGIDFTTYELLRSSALMFVSFGSEFEIGLVGVTSGYLPPGQPKSSLAYVEMGLVAAIKPRDKSVSVRAQLTSNSYLLAPDCTLTGGFAATWWFGAPHQGDFVLSLGGYHPVFARPALSPVVPAIGIDWSVSRSANVVGTTYCAMTPSCFMAGGYLRVLFEDGGLQAWLNAGANFLIGWQPFHYEADIGVGVGVGVRYSTSLWGVRITLTAELGAWLELYGPETAGRIRVNWSVVSFTIPIGDRKNSVPVTPSWEVFARELLPPPSSAAKDADAVGDRAHRPQRPADPAHRHRHPGHVVHGRKECRRLFGRADRGASVRRARCRYGAEGRRHRHGVRQGGRSGGGKATITALRAGAAEAMWSRSAFNPAGPPTAAMIEGALFGIRIRLAASTDGGGVGPIDLDACYKTPGNPPQPLPFVLPGTIRPTTPPPQVDRLAVLMSTVMKPAVAATRRGILHRLADRRVSSVTVTDPDLSVVASFAWPLYQEPPALGALTDTLPPAAARPVSGMAAAPPPMAARPAIDPPRLVAGLRRYRLGGVVAGRWLDEAWPGAAALRGMLAPTPEAGVAVRLHEGTVVVCTVDDTGLAHVAPEGNVPVRVLAFDRHGRPLDHRECPAGGVLTLPARTATVALQGQGPAGSLVGWGENTALARVEFHTFLGDSFLVRPQAPPRLSAVRRTVPRGLIDAADLIAENQVRTLDRAKASG